MSQDLELANPGITPEELEQLIAQRRRRRRILVSLVLLLVVAPGAGWFGWKLYQRGPSAAHHYEQALIHQAEGNLRSALVELKNTLKKRPTDAKARLTLGQIYLELGDGLAAEKELLQARGLEGAAEEIELGLLRAKFLQQELDVVLAGLDALASRRPQALLLRGDVLLAKLRFTQAAVAYDALLELDPGSIDGLLGMARARMAQGDTEGANKSVAAAMQLSETNFNTWATKGHLASLSHDYEAAMLAYERALALRPGDSSTKVQQARVLLELGRTEEAEQRLTQLHNANPRAPLINYLRAVAAVQRGELETAKAALLSVLSVAPGHPESYLLLAAIYLQERNFEEAEASVQNVLDVTPEYLPGIKLLAAIQVEQGRAEEAIETLKSVLSDVPDDVQALGLLGSAYMQVGEFDKANQALSQAAKLAPDVAIIRTQLALIEFGTGKSEEALAQLSAVTAANSSFVQADLLIVSVHLERREFAEALEAAVKFAEKQPDNPMPHNLMGGAYEGLGDIALAREAFERALALDAHFVAAVLNLARLDLIAGDKTGASERYTQALERNPHHHAVLSRLAALAFDAGDTARGVELLEESRRHNPTDVLSRLTLSRWHLQTGHSAAALPVAEEAFALAPEMPRTILALSRAELLNGKGDSAVSRLTTLSKDYPESIEALFQLAGAQVSLRRLSDAEKSYEKILELDNDHPGARLGLGQVALLEARYKDALLLAGTLQTSHPDNAHGYVLQGDALAASGNPGEAIEAYQAALSRTPTSQLAIALSSVFRDSGQIVKAASFLNAWLAEYPNDNRVKAYLAESAMTAGHSDEAIVHYEQIIATSPNNITALNNLAYLYHERGDQRALEVSRRAYELAPNHPSIMDTYGWLLVQSGEFQKGVEILEESVNKGPENTEHRLHLGMALLKAGKPPAARDVFQALVNLESDFPEKAKAQELLELIE